MEVSVNGESYVIEKMRNKQQFNVLRRLLPIMTAMDASASALKGELDADNADAFVRAIGPIASAIGGMTDADSDYIFDSCLSAVKRKTAAGWQTIMVGGELRYQDIALQHQLTLLFYALKENFADFLGAVPGPSSAGAA